MNMKWILNWILNWISCFLVGIASGWLWANAGHTADTLWIMIVAIFLWKCSELILTSSIKGGWLTGGLFFSLWITACGIVTAMLGGWALAVIALMTVSTILHMNAYYSES